MRTLHPVAAHERFTGSGVYRRRVSGEDVGQTESWSIHELQDGEQFIRIDQDMRPVNGMSRLVEVLRQLDGRVERLTIREMNDSNAAGGKIIRSDYQFEAGYVYMSRQIDTGERRHTELKIPDDTVVRLTHFILFWGKMMQLAASLTADAPVFVPLLKSGFAPGRLVNGALPSIVDAEDEEITFSKRDITVRRYQTSGHRFVWVNERGIPVRIAHAPGQIVDDLTNYAYRK